MTLLVPAAAVATKLGLDPQRLPPPVKARIEDAIMDAQTKVETHLGRPLVATETTITSLYPDVTYPLNDHRAWPQAKTFLDDRYRVADAVPVLAEPGTYNVTFKVGLDVANDPDLNIIRRFLLIDAAENLTADPLFTAVKRVPSSVSAGGQSVSYTTPKGADPGGAITLKSLNRWKRRPIARAVHVNHAIFPYGI